MFLLSIVHAKGMFTYIKESNVFWFSPLPASTDDEQIAQQLSEYHLVGVLMGLAVYNGEILDIHLPPCVYKKLAVLDHATYELIQSQQKLDLKSKQNDDGTTGTNSDQIGVCDSMNLYDLRQVMPCVAASLQDLLDHDGDVRADFMMSFVASYTDPYEVVQTVELKPNGAQIELTNENRLEYVDLYVDFLLNRSIYRQFRAFYLGFHSVCASNAMIVN